ncbi:MAG: hypothetical protein EA365_05395 [Gloeocapsa sp. DLM2.Bin57]|nr:MAG: hypothetical protein EA365_05395 [Gloeocapsa sp. DLM2.Bin57]
MKIIRTIILTSSLVALISVNINSASAVDITLQGDRLTNIRKDNLFASRQNRQSRNHSRTSIKRKPILFNRNSVVCSPNADTIRIRGSHRRVRRNTYSNCK